MASYLNDDLRCVGKDLVEIGGYFGVDGASAVLTTAAGTQPAAGLVGTWTKSAGVGIYKFTFRDSNAWNDIWSVLPNVLGVAGTLDRCVDYVAKNLNSQNFVSSIDVQVRKKSDGTAVDPVSLTFCYRILAKNSSVRP